MKTMYFKLGPSGMYSYCNKLSSGYKTVEVTNIPEEVTIDEVLVQLHKTAIWKAKSIEYDQLGEGNFIKRNTLTPTEIRIVKLIASERLTNRQIAERMGIAEGTVRTHISKILIKLNIKSRKEL
jgi:DNA-binding CsgD family transcriptional regulator